jgi:hypothetical protein
MLILFFSRFIKVGFKIFNFFSERYTSLESNNLPGAHPEFFVGDGERIDPENIYIYIKFMFDFKNCVIKIMIWFYNAVMSQV